MAFMDAWKLVFAALFMLQLTSYQTAAGTQPPALSMEDRYKQWMAQHGRAYKDETEKVKRFKIFKENVEYIESFNAAGEKSYKLGINEFADLTNEEFGAARNGYQRDSHPILTPFKYANVSSVPGSLDWRKVGAVTGVKDQGSSCGSCWAFSVVASTEGINKLKTGKLISLSEQQLVDCDKIEAYGCHRGNMQSAFEYIIRNKGLTSESNYPYQGADGTCNTQEEAYHVATITGYENVPPNSESSLLKAVANQPVSVGVDATGSQFQFYKTGVLTGECGTDLNHAITIVGYGATLDGQKYWLAKNSWGTNWGEAGYIRVQRDFSSALGQCGIAMVPTYPTL